MNGRAIAHFVAKLAHAVVAWVEHLEHPLALGCARRRKHTVELHEIAYHVGPYGHVADTSAAKALHSPRQLRTVWAKDHVARSLRRLVATLQPVAVRTLMWWQRNAFALHQCLHTAATTASHTLRRVNNQRAVGLASGQQRQRALAPGHRQHNVGSAQVVSPETFLVKQARARQLGHCTQYGLVLSHAVGREAHRAAHSHDVYPPSHLSSSSALAMSAA